MLARLAMLARFLLLAIMMLAMSALFAYCTDLDGRGALVCTMKTLFVQFQLTVYSCVS